MKLEEVAKGNFLDLAVNTHDSQLLEELANSYDAQVRRAVARNSSTPSNTLATLAYDPVMNVCYMAMKNPNCRENRTVLESNHPCVKCEKDEKTMYCVNCSTLEKYGENF